MIKIKDIVVPTKGVGKYFGIKCLQIDIRTDSEASPTFYWEVKTESTDGVETIPGEVILEGTLPMTKQEYSNWNSDDNYVIDWGLNKLGFEKTNI